MSKIILGKSDRRDVKLDLDVLLRTRMLIQANSRKGAVRGLALHCVKGFAEAIPQRSQIQTNERNFRS